MAAKRFISIVFKTVFLVKWYFKNVLFSFAPNTSQLAARMKARRTLRSLGEGGWKGFGKFRENTPELCSDELHFTAS